MVGVPGQVLERIETSDGRLAVERHGPAEGQPVIVCLHGLSANRATWRPVARRLADRHQFLLMDLLGRGDSDTAPHARYDLDSEVRRLVSALERMRVLRPVLAGHSHGAAIALAAAEHLDARGLFLVNPITPDVRRPALLGLLSLPFVRSGLGPVLRIFRRPLTRYILVRRVFADDRYVTNETVSRYATPWRDPDRAAALPGILGAWNPEELRPWARRADRPVRVVAGAHDRRIGAELARRWAGELGASFDLLPDCGHSAPEEKPDETAALLANLLHTVQDRERGYDTE